MAWLVLLLLSGQKNVSTMVMKEIGDDGGSFSDTFIVVSDERTWEMMVGILVMLVMAGEDWSSYCRDDNDRESVGNCFGYVDDANNRGDEDGDAAGVVSDGRSRDDGEDPGDGGDGRRWLNYGEDDDRGRIDNDLGLCGIDNDDCYWWWRWWYRSW